MSVFTNYLQAAGKPLVRSDTRCLQVNVGYRCNLQCSHCHVEAGPKRTEVMGRKVMEDVLAFAETAGVREIDITGGAPELNPDLEYLLRLVRQLPSVDRILLRTNLSILDEPDFVRFPELFAKNRVEIVASMPCYMEENVDAQRGSGVHTRNIRVLQKLNLLGYGTAGSDLKLHLVYNPLGNFLPGRQDELETAYKEHLRNAFGISFDSLYTITNMPIGRFRSQLEKQGLLEGYMNLLVENFNLPNLDNVMCRTMLSINWEGRIFDCDFNQALKLPGAIGDAYIGETDPQSLAGLPVATGDHCFACVAGAGSSCQGNLEPKAG